MNGLLPIGSSEKIKRGIKYEKRLDAPSKSADYAVSCQIWRPEIRTHRQEKLILRLRNASSPEPLSSRLHLQSSLTPRFNCGEVFKRQSTYWSNWPQAFLSKPMKPIESWVSSTTDNSIGERPSLSVMQPISCTLGHLDLTLLGRDPNLFSKVHFSLARSVKLTKWCHPEYFRNPGQVHAVAYCRFVPRISWCVLQSINIEHQLAI